MDELERAPRQAERRRRIYPPRPAPDARLRYATTRDSARGFGRPSRASPNRLEERRRRRLSRLSVREGKAGRGRGLVAPYPRATRGACIEERGSLKLSPSRSRQPSLKPKQR